MQKIKMSLKKEGLGCETDTRNEKISYKIRTARLERIPYMLAVGEKEVTATSASARRQDDGDLGSMPISRLVEMLQNGQPELCALVVTYIHAKHIFPVIHVNSNGNIDSAFYNTAFMSHMIVDGIHKNNRVNVFQRSFLSFFMIGRILSVIRLMTLSEMSMS